MADKKKNKPEIRHFDGEDKSTFTPFSTMSEKAVSNLEKRIQETLTNPNPPQEFTQEQLDRINDIWADQEHWAKLSSWTLIESVCLAHKFDYERCMKKKRPQMEIIQGLGVGGRDIDGYGEPWVTMDKQYKLMTRAVEDGQLKNRNHPMIALGWMLEKEFDLPEWLMLQTRKAWKKQEATLEREKKAREANEVPESKAPSAAPKTKEPGSELLENRLRLIGSLVEILEDAERSKKHFTSDTDLMNYLKDHYDNIGSDTTLKTAFADARKLIVKKPKEK